ncbi:magnesium-dependent phosphatase-1 [Meredithblackwellia eburnea MCA 4105]
MTKPNTTTSTANGSDHMPKLVAFDLDFTLWDLWVDTHVTPPLKRRKAEDLNKVYDRYGQEMGFYEDVPEILLSLHRSKVHVAAASRTSAPRAARQALSELQLPGTLNKHLEEGRGAPTTVSAIDLFDTMEIYPGSKLTHFKEIHKKTGIAYKDMVFYDDEPRNREVASLGVTFVLVREGEGVTHQVFQRGLNSWREANKVDIEKGEA